MRPKDFQKAAINRICEIFSTGVQNKVLLADEVGLGKTIVARGVIETLAQKHHSVNAKPFRVVYICSNANIANQNAEKLGVPKKDCLKVSESRLSMQHLKILQRQENAPGKTQLIPLTPATSFSLTNGCGTQNERALIFALLHRLTDLKRIKCFSAFMRHYQLLHWPGRVNEARSKIEDCDKSGKVYFAEVREALQGSDFVALKEKITALCGQKDTPRADRIVAINDLRTFFARFSLEKLEPNLVIMDEFQRFSELLLQKDSNESSMLFNKFIRGHDTRVLLLSATPYKPYSTPGESNQGEIEHHKEFLNVMSFLQNTPQKIAAFKDVWKSYSQSLSELSRTGAAVLHMHKSRTRAAEASLYENICRTERSNYSIIDDSGVKEVPVSSADVLSYVEIQRYLRACNVAEVPVDYVKSSPYLLSFMDRYKQKEALKKLSAHKRLVKELPKYATLLLKESDIEKFKPIPPNNARLQYLEDLIFDRGKMGAGKNEMERLLWLPPSRPYYSVAKGPFAQKKNLSKFLVFSSWEMVPRMLASLLSYEAERLICAKLPKKKRYFTEEDKKRAGTTQLRNGGDELLTYACVTLAKLYEPHAHDGKSIVQVRKHIGGLVRQCLRQCMKRHDIRKAESSRGGAKNLALLLRLLDDETQEVPSVIPANAESVLTDIAIASPAVCAYRLLGKQTLASKIGLRFVSLFEKPDSADILNIPDGKAKKTYYERALAYCAEGNLQAVLDEWAYVLNKRDDDLVATMEQAFLKSVTVPVDTLESFSDGKRKKPRLRNHFAVGYFDARLEDKNVERAENIRVAFNSPLRPFVLATTSIGQEGLDFHLYCRKICHWNLPANPVDLEQREGRINRYQCLAIRQNIAARYADAAKKDAVWEGMFQIASKKEKQGFSDLVPYWCLPDAAEPQVKIERLVPMYPFSKDAHVYKRLIRVLMFYRLTLGQPRQEELLTNLEDVGLTLQDVQGLFFNLSPYWRASGRRPA